MTGTDRRSWKRLVRPTLLLLATAGCTFAPSTEIRAVPSASPGAPTFELNGEVSHPTGCFSGQPENFLGVDLIDAKLTTDLRVIIDPATGPRLRFTRGAPKEARDRTVFDAASCKTLRANVEPTIWHFNGVQDYSGDVTADCVSAAGATLEAHIEFQHCH